MASLNPYLNFPGTSEQAFNFYKSVFGGEFAMLQRYAETPEGDKLSAEDASKIMRIALPIGKKNVLMATDALESMGKTLTEGNNFSLSFSTDSKDEATKLYNELSAGGQKTMHMQDTFRGSYFGMLTDMFGIQWMISYDHENNK